VLNNYLSNVSTNDDGVLPEFDRVAPANTEFNDVMFTPANVKRVLRKLKNKVSCGLDGLPPTLFKKLAPCLAFPLSVLYNNSMSVGRLPDEWKKAVITPIAKGGIASDPCNYRPISLTSVACKVMERIIVKQLSGYLHQHGLISKQQHGFLVGKSTSTNLLETLSDWTFAINNGDGVPVAYIDYAKAFDSVSHPKLIHKLKSYGISGNVLYWIENFLSARMQCTRVGNSVSSMQNLSSGVIQGSCLGPLLFVIYINDIVKLFDEHCVVKLYADDLKMYMYVNLPDCTTKFQGYLDRLATWSDAWQLTISCKKCSVLQVGKGGNNQVYCLASQPIAAADTVKDLGVYVDKHLKFADHIQHIVTNASKRASLIHKCFISKDTPTKVHAFTVYVRPLLDYASYVWSPHLFKDIRHVTEKRFR